ncbi:MAG: IS200/IS605 family accessory protein TnpB-related protein [Candidatus Njordarchaeales archaeon]
MPRDYAEYQRKRAHKEKSTKQRENKKKDRRFKIANIIVNTAKQLRGVVVLEKLPKKCPENMIRNIHNKKLRHRIYQAGFRTLLKTIIEKCEEKGVLYILVNLRGTSSVCPFCDSKLMRGDAPRQLYCKKCKKIFGRDVVAVLNLEKKATLKGRVPFAPMPNDSSLEVAVLPMKDWMRRKSLPLIPNETILARMMR